MNPFRAAKTWIERRYLGGAGLGGAGFTSSSGLPAPVLSGVAVSPETALTFSAWYACINALATDLAAMPFYVERYRPGKGRRELPTDPRHDLLYCEPNRHLGALDFRRTVYGHRFGWGNGYARVVRRGGMPVEFQIQSPRDMDTWPELDRAGNLWYMTDGGRGKPVRAEDMIHLKGLGFSGLKGYSPVALHRQGIGYGIAVEQFGAAFYGNAATPRGALKVQKKLTPEGMKNLRESVAAVHQDTTNAHRLMILEEGTEFQGFSVDPVDAEYIATRKFQVVEMCRILQVPPPRIMDFSDTSSVYKALADMIQSYLTFTLVPETVATQQEFDRKIFTSRERAHGLRTAHDFESLLKADPIGRMNYFEKRFGLGTITPDEIREREGDAPTPGAVGDRFFVSKNYLPIDQAGAPETPAPAGGKPGDEPDGDEPAEPDGSAPKQKRFNPNHGKDGKFAGGKGGGGGGGFAKASGVGAGGLNAPPEHVFPADPKLAPDLHATADRLKAAAPEGAAVHVASGLPRTNKDEAAVDKAWDAGREHVARVSGVPQAEAHRDGGLTSYRVGGGQAATVEGNEDGSRWAMTAYIKGTPDSGSRTYKTRDQAEAYAERHVRNTQRAETVTNYLTGKDAPGLADKAEATVRDFGAKHDVYAYFIRGD